VVSTTPRPLYPRERRGTHCTGGWVGPRAGLDVCEKSRPHRDSIAGPSISQPVDIPTELPGPFCNMWLCIYTVLVLIACLLVMVNSLVVTEKCLNMKQCRLHKQTVVIYTVMLLCIWWLYQHNNTGCTVHALKH
jgi:hypothetical protein